MARPQHATGKVSARRTELLAALDREGRRSGSTGAMHAKALSERAGIHSTDWECIDVLDWSGPLPAGELAKRVGITSGAVTGAIDRLERRGLVQRVADPNDRRRVIVELQPDGIDPGQLMTFFAPLAADMNEVNERFDDDQLAAVLDWLAAANDAIERSIARLRER